MIGSAPHLSGSLRIFEIKGRRILEVACVEGYINHINGTRNLDLARIEDRNGDGAAEIVLPRINNGGVVVVTFAGGKPQEL